MWDTYAEGLSAAEGLPAARALLPRRADPAGAAANTEAHYSVEELRIAEAFDELPEDMRRRLARGERGQC